MTKSTLDEAEYLKLASRIASTYRHRSDPTKVAYTFLARTLAEFVGEVEKAVLPKRAESQESISCDEAFNNYVKPLCYITHDHTPEMWPEKYPFFRAGYEAGLANLAPASGASLKFYRAEIENLKEVHQTDLKDAESWRRLVQHARLSGNDLDVEYTNTARPITKDAIRAAGGIVHSDGSVFFNSMAQIDVLRENLK